MLISVIIAAFVVVFSIIVFIRWKGKRTVSVRYEHFLITGGSSGIGFAFACEAAERGASVTILARNQLMLDKAKSRIESRKRYPEQVVESFAADVTWDEDKLKSIIMKAEDKSGPITFLVNCAGNSICNRFEETPLSDFKNMMDLNFMGSVSMTRLVLPSMKKRRKGNIIFFSSIAGLIGIHGYSAYSASKFALLGMAQALQMEVTPFNLTVTVSFPPDTDTPGYATEIISKLEETKLISESAGLFSAEAVASATLDDALKSRFMSSIGSDGLLVTSLCCGGSPASYSDLAFQVLFIAPCRLLGFCYLKNSDRIIKRYIKAQKTIEQED